MLLHDTENNLCLGQTSIYGYPASMAPIRIPSLLVVGASGLDGSIWRETWKGTNTDSPRGIPTIYAPSLDGVSCATGMLGNEYRVASASTSMATASVAGLAAYFLGVSSLACQPSQYSCKIEIFY